MSHGALSGICGGLECGQRVDLFHWVRRSLLGRARDCRPLASKKLTHIYCAVFSLGDHRRRMLGPSANLPPDYFQPEGRSAETDELRAKVRITLEEEVARYFKENEGQVAIFDANVSRGSLARRSRVSLREHAADVRSSLRLAERHQGGADSVEAEVRGARGQCLLHRCARTHLVSIPHR